MREIKFRGKDISTGEWRYGSYIYQPVFASAFPQDGRTPPKETATRIYMPETFESDPKICSVDPATVGQYTGLHDSTEQEVYEGDILSDARGRLYVIVWRAGGSCVYSADEYRDMRRKVPVTLHDALADRQVSNYVQEGLTVVGNIHDDAELLTPKDN